MDHLEGISLRQYLASDPDRMNRERAIASFGHSLKQAHEYPCPMEWRQSDQDWLDSMLIKAANNLAHYSVDGTEELLSSLRKNRPSSVQPTLIHGDFTMDNVIVRDGEVIGIIDWAGASCGDPRYDVALATRPKANAFEDQWDKEIFYDAYGRLRLTDEEYRYFEDGIYNFFKMYRGRAGMNL